MKSIDQCFDVRKELGLEDLPNEIWRDIPNYEGVYQVSNLGRVKSLAHYIYSENACYKSKLINEKILRMGIDRYGYYQVILCVKQKRKCIKVHRLVAKAFISNIEQKPEIDHINGIKTDNRLSNLRWATHSENKLNPVTYKLIIGSKSYRARKIINLSTGKIFNCIKDAAQFYKVQYTSVIDAIRRNHKCASCNWAYYDEFLRGHVE